MWVLGWSRGNTGLVEDVMLAPWDLAVAVI